MSLRGSIKHILCELEVLTLKHDCLLFHAVSLSFVNNNLMCVCVRARARTRAGGKNSPHPCVLTLPRCLISVFHAEILVERT